MKCSDKIGRGPLYSFSEARKIARQYGFVNRQEFLEYECPGAYQLPKNPERVWEKEWTSWEDFLGVNHPFDRAVSIARSLNLKSQEDYTNLFSNPNAVENDDEASRLPFKPDIVYKDQWQGWDYFLGF
mmetsp:Transcript_33419/g.48381  ORF Transcript_33419/g.48381 Transcript_33419/m.48381 type:complete len:128 (-) Transcript_33419:162-545(-)